MEYTFKLKEGRKTVPVAVFADSAYEPAGEFLLAETFSEASGISELSGNVFTLTLNGDDAEIYNEVTESQLTVSRGELKALARDYSAEVKRLRKRK